MCWDFTFLEVQWLRLHLPKQGGVGSIPSVRAKIPHDSQPKHGNIKKKKKARSNIVTKFNKDLKIVHLKNNTKQNKNMLSTYFVPGDKVVNTRKKKFLNSHSRGEKEIIIKSKNK